MKSKTFFIILIFVLIISGLKAQENPLFIPSEIQQAYNKGTRSYDGKSGPQYWQNTVDYSIEVEITSERMVVGSEEVIYHNSSPDTLYELVVRLYADVYKKGNFRDNAISYIDITDGVKLKEVFINGNSYDLNDRKKINRSGTKIIVQLEKPLFPGSDLNFRTSWEQKIPLHNARTGAYDSISYFVAQWYPQIAVYDDLFGWDYIDFTFGKEFYNNLANFDVNITVPEDCMVWATGNLQNAQELMPDNIYDKYTKARSSSEVVHIITAEDLNNGIKTTDQSWHYKASEVSDFAFAVCNNYLWDGGILETDNRKIFVSSVYLVDTAKIYREHWSNQKKAMKCLSEDIPGIPFPYDAFTTFLHYGFFCMEYPMIANNGLPNYFLTIHEMAHTYFPMYVRTNESRWTWMDEGCTVFNTTAVVKRHFEEDYEIADMFSCEHGYDQMGKIGDLPLITSTQYLNGDNIDFESYYLPSMVNAILLQHLGEELFLKCYHEYIIRWAKKSPSPYDYFFTFEDVSGEDLSWLWKPWFFEFGVIDLAIKSFNNGILTIVKKGNKPVPVFLNIKYANGKKEHIVQSANVWADNTAEFKIEITDYDKVESIIVNTPVADINKLDNFYPNPGIIYKGTEIDKSILGNYMNMDYYFKMKIYKQGELFYFIVPDLSRKHILYQLDDLHYNSLDNSVNLIFTRDDAGNYKSFDFYLHGFELKCIKQD